MYYSINSEYGSPSLSWNVLSACLFSRWLDKLREVCLPSRVQLCVLLREHSLGWSIFIANTQSELPLIAS